MEDSIVVVACPNEIKLIPEEFKHFPCFIIGVGALNAIEFASKIDPNTLIINIGYAGSNYFNVGETVEVGISKLKHKVYFKDTYYKLSQDSKVVCYSSSDFEEFPAKNDKKAVYDMELAFICAVHRKTKSYKTISDSLNYDDYGRFVESND